MKNSLLQSSTLDPKLDVKHQYSSGFLVVFFFFTCFIREQIIVSWREGVRVCDFSPSAETMIYKGIWEGKFSDDHQEFIVIILLPRFLQFLILN